MCSRAHFTYLWNESRFECFKGTRSCYLVPAITGIGMSEKRGIISFLCMTLVVLIWSGSFIFIRLGLRELTPSVLALARFAIASPPLVIYTLLLRKRHMQTGFNWRTHSLLFLALGLTGGTFLYVLQFYSLRFVTATVGSILINLNVVFATILSGILLKEHMSAKKLVGVSLAFMGVIVLAANGGSFTDSAPVQSTGALLMVGAALCWALYSILTKNALHLFSASTITSATFVIGTVCLLPFAMVEMSTAPITSVSLSTWISILYLAIPSSTIAYLLWNHLLKGVEVTKLAVSLYAIPIPTAVFSYLLLGEAITYFMVVGGILVVLGIILTQSG